MKNRIIFWCGMGLLALGLLALGPIALLAQPSPTVTPPVALMVNKTTAAIEGPTAALTLFRSANSIGSGTITSVAASVPAFLSVSGTPITSSGTLAITYSGTALPVANGGTGATTLTGYVKGTGTSAMTAAATVPVADLSGTLSVAGGGTGATTLTGYVKGTGTAALSGSATIPNTDVTGLGTMSTQNASGVAITGGTITGMSAPTAGSDVATKAYVDAFVQGIDVRASCRVTSLSNITLSGTQTIDGVAAIAGDRVLVQGQTTGANNGIYVVAAGAWSRATDADESSEVTTGMFTFVSEGTLGGSNGYVLITPDPITLGSTSLSFAQFSGAGQIIAGTGISKSGNTLSVNQAFAPTWTGTHTFSLAPVLSSTTASTLVYVDAGKAVGSVSLGSGLSLSTGTLSISASTVLDAIGNTRGSMLYRGSSGWAILTPGTSGYLLTSGGAGADPSWAANTAPTAANPSASVGLTPVNGSAPTFMRSDGAPALDVTIVPTWSGSHTFSKNSAASTPTIAITGTWYASGSATTTKPHVLIETSGATSTAWGTSGTGLGVNAASGFAGNLADFQANGTSRWKVDATGIITATGAAGSAIGGLGFNILSTNILDWEGGSHSQIQVGNASSGGGAAGIRVRLGVDNSPGVTPGLGTDTSHALAFYTNNTAAMSIDTSQNIVINKVLTAASATATPAGGSTAARMLFGTTAGFGIYYGSGAPTVSAAQGSIYLRSDGTTTNDRFYINTNGSTTWTAVTTGS